MNISELLNDISKPKMLTFVPCGCHQVKAKEILNNIICENPKLSNTVYALSLYRVFSWAWIKQKEYETVIEDILILFRSNDGEECINEERIKGIEYHLGDILSSELLRIEEPYRSCINSVHGYNRGHPSHVSDYIMTRYYKNAVVLLSEAQCEAVNSLFDDLKGELECLTDEDRIAYHDINMLFSLAREVSSDYEASPEAEDLLRDLIALSDALNEYTISGKELSFIVKEFLTGSTEEVIAKKLSRSRNYVRKRYKEAKDILAVLLFGLMTKETVNWLFKE